MANHGLERVLKPLRRSRAQDDLRCGVLGLAIALAQPRYGSIRMEPVFMILGQSAAAAANLAIAAGCAVQDVPYRELRDQLIRDGQVLGWDELTAELAEVV